MSSPQSRLNPTVIALWETAATMKVHGLSPQDIQARLTEIGLRPETAAGAVDGVDEFIRRTGGTGRMPSPPRIFLSHSHADRDGAVYLLGVLEKNGIQSFLDQHQIVPGQDLKDRIMLGLLWSDCLLLLWSRAASASKWVEWEWTRAKRLTKQVLPYALDQTPLPAPLSGLVHIEASDQHHGHAQLLRTLLGKQWKPEKTTPFPGHWLAELNLMGFGAAEYEFELHANGQLRGSGRIKPGGFLGSQVAGLGLANLLDLKIPLTGQWSYDDRAKSLQLDVVASFMGQTNRDTVVIQTSGTEKGWLEGETLGGLPWRLRRAR